MTIFSKNDGSYRGDNPVYQEKRRTPRIVFIAVAEITDQESGGQLTGRVTELSAYGCYVDILNTLPAPRTVTIKIFAESECFEAKANVIYAHQNLGMGLVFQEISLQSGNLLRHWLVKGIST
jgi:PilZ domain